MLKRMMSMAGRRRAIRHAQTPDVAATAFQIPQEIRASLSKGFEPSGVASMSRPTHNTPHRPAPRPIDVPDFGDD